MKYTWVNLESVDLHMYTDANHRIAMKFHQVLWQANDFHLIIW